MAKMFKFFKNSLKTRTSYADDSLVFVIQSWEAIDTIRRLVNKIGDGKSVDEIENIQAQIEALYENIKARNEGYFRLNERDEPPWKELERDTTNNPPPSRINDGQSD